MNEANNKYRDANNHLEDSIKRVLLAPFKMVSSIYGTVKRIALDRLFPSREEKARKVNMTDNEKNKASEEFFELGNELNSKPSDSMAGFELINYVKKRKLKEENDADNKE